MLRHMKGDDVMTEKLHIFAVSDSVGETAEKIAAASVLQFKVERSITRFSRVTKEEQVMEIIDGALGVRSCLKNRALVA